MISPAEIKLKLERLYPQAVQASLVGDATFFPLRIRANLALSKSQSEAIAEVESLRNQSKQSVGYGYRVEWEETRSRTYGLNHFPQGLWIDSIEDLARLIGKLRSFQSTERVARKICLRIPKLHDWAVASWRKLADLEDRIDDLMLVTERMIQHPRPNCFPRELPLAVPTKLVAENKNLLAEWWDVVLPEGAIDVGCDPRNFSARYGFREVREHLMIRILDVELLQELQLPTTELSISAEYLSKLPMRNTRIVIVENKVNLLTLPKMERTVALGGLGMGITQIFGLPWLFELPIVYWGDLDVEGFEILALVRRRFPQVKSCLMNREILDRFESLATVGKGRLPVTPSELSISEVSCFERCRDANLRLEQEHIPQPIADEHLVRSLGGFELLDGIG